MLDPYIHDPKLGRKIIWKILDHRLSDFPSEPVISDHPEVIRAPWGEQGAVIPVSICIELTFDGFRPSMEEPGYDEGVVSIVYTPEDAVLTVGSTQKPKVEGAMSPRDHLKAVAERMAKHRMYAGARIMILGAHFGLAGSRFGYQLRSGVDGWAILHGRREREVARQINRLNFLQKWWRGRQGIPLTSVDRLSILSPADPWAEPGVRKHFDALFEGSGLHSGPGKLAVMSLLRKVGRDNRVKDVRSRFKAGVQTVFIGDSEEESYQRALSGSSPSTMIEVGPDDL
jgi:hypothetical protein